MITSEADYRGTIARIERFREFIVAMRQTTISPENFRASAGGFMATRLACERPDLVAAIVAGEGVLAVQDPSNRDDRFDRVRLRNALAGADWLDPVAAGRSAAALA